MNMFQDALAASMVYRDSWRLCLRIMVPVDIFHHTCRWFSIKIIFSHCNTFIQLQSKITVVSASGGGVDGQLSSFVYSPAVLLAKST